MGQRSSHSEKKEWAHVAKNGATLTPTAHKVELLPRPGETPAAGGAGGGKKKQKRQKKGRFSSLFCCFSSPDSTKVVGEQVEQDTTPKKSSSDDQTSLQDVTCVVEDPIPQVPPVSAPDTCPQDQEEEIEDQTSLQDVACTVEDPQVPPVSGPDNSPSAEDQQKENTCPRDQEEDIKDHICRNYILGQKLGEGGFGSVYECFRREDGLPVAMKIITKTGNESYICLPDHPRPVPLEVGLTVMANQGPRCPNIIELLDWQDHPDYYIIVLERPQACIDMHRFREHQGHSFDEKLARHFMQQVTEAALMCCSRGVLHRDIKLPNLLVCQDTLDVKLIDFGCGDILQSAPYNTYSGTAQYCPPEYLDRGEYFGKQATVWSLGVLLYRMITSQFPDGIDITMMEMRGWTQTGVSDECSRFIQGCLKRDPEQRLRLEDLLLHDWFNKILL